MTEAPPDRRRAGISILSKLLAMLLGVSLLSALVAGIVGYRNGTDSLRAAAIERMVEVRESRAREIEAYMDGLRHTIILDSRGIAAQAIPELHDAFRELDAEPVPASEQAAVREYYEQTFVPELEGRQGGEADVGALLPTSDAAWHLQASYTAADADWDARLATDDAGDGSAWSAAHARYHDFFRETVEQKGYEDILLLDDEGNVVYSAYKGVDLGTNVLTGPHAGGALQDVFEQAERATSVDTMAISDLDRYTPSEGRPTMFAASPVGSGGQTTGVLVYQVPMDEIDGIMTSGGAWEKTGLGRTGETYLVGPDHLMRSVSRGLLEDPEEYRDQVVANGTPRETADRQLAVTGSVLLQPVESYAVDESLRGRSGTGVSTDYRGHETLGAWMPLDIPGLQWVLVAELDTSEAFEPVRDFTRNLLISVAVLVLLVSLASLLLAQVFVRPVRHLVSGVREVAAGNLDARVAATSRDEFGELAGAFNDMARSLRTKADLLDERQGEYERLLHTLMPEAVARRYQDGEETIAESHSDVTVVYAEVVGLDDLTRDMSSDEELETVNLLVRGFDEAAERLGVEKVRTLRSGYLASCGLVVPRVDSARRSVEFVREMQRVVAAFDAQHDAALRLRAGLDTGTVTSGLVGRQNVVYDLWGDAVNLAFSLPRASDRPGVFVSAAVHDRLRDQYSFREAGTVESRTGAEPVWELEEDSRG
ncbi:adenylate/guanylate cyclase domain-containing protein [Promicromonospora sukumoe]|uniref:adenylate/guanylate cyclase domain-containing protein n=1 Tax=Promicromonospora sukumoe TaxID=88382 RepID=UPI003667D6CD